MPRCVGWLCPLKLQNEVSPDDEENRLRSEKKAVVKVNQNNVASVACLCKWLVFKYLSSWLVEDDEQYSSATQFRTWTISVKPDKHANSAVLLELKTHNMYVERRSFIAA